ncbi:MAG TPA: AIR carboxylase family protein, partial [Candidatus Omnitrophica bacterium]|nr:AIR carboxylase family protein [Candidatus Omnitrophota bacterium]
PLPGGELKGLDAFISILQMPSGIPVATMSIGGPGVKNAVLLATEILAIYDERLKKKINKYRENLRKNVVEKDAKLSSMFE